MTNFLRAGLFAENIKAIGSRARRVMELAGRLGADQAELVRTCGELNMLASDMADFLDRLACEPLIYTGKEDADHMVELLDRLLAEYQASQRG